MTTEKETVPFIFQIHHIFPSDLFNNPLIAADLAALLSKTDAALSVEVSGNEIALFNNPDTPAIFRR